MRFFRSYYSMSVLVVSMCVMTELAFAMPIRNFPTVTGASDRFRYIAPEMVAAQNERIKLISHNLASAESLAVKAEECKEVKFHSVLDSYRRPQGIIKVRAILPSAGYHVPENSSDGVSVVAECEEAAEGEETIDALREIEDLIKAQEELWSSRWYIGTTLQRIENSMAVAFVREGVFSYDRTELRRCTQFLLNLPEDDCMRRRYRGWLPAPILLRNPVPINDTTLPISDSESRNAA